MARTSALRNAALLLALALLAACRETTVAPAECPSLCPPSGVELVDTVLTGIVVRDSSYRPYVTAEEAAILKLSNDTTARSAAVLRFFPRPDFWFEGDLTDTIRLGRIDSVTITVRIAQRDTLVDSARILVYRVPRPRAIDTLTTYDSIAPWIHDSLLVDTIIVPDSVVNGLVTRVMPATAFAPDAADSNIVSAILVLDAPVPTALNLTANGFTGAVQLAWYARAADTTKLHTFTSLPTFDTFVQSPAPPPMLADRLFVGNLPSARALLRFDIPRYFVDSTTIVSASLVLTPVVPIGGVAGQPFVVEARAIIRDFGRKSFFTTDASLGTSVMLTPGDTAQVALALTGILRTWRGIEPDSLPRTIILRVTDEGRTLGELAFAPSTAGALAPFLRLSYVKPFIFGAP